MELYVWNIFAPQCGLPSHSDEEKGDVITKPIFQKEFPYDAKAEGGSLFCTKIVRGGISALSGPMGLQVGDYT